MKKILYLLLCLYLIKSNYLTDIKDYLQNTIFHEQKNETEDSNPEVLTSLYEQMRSLEIIYNDKLLIAHGINPSELHEEIEKISDYQKKAEFRKTYIMEKANLTEQEYHDIFVHPLSQITNTKETTINDIKNSYDEIKEKINGLENLIDLITP